MKLINKAGKEIKEGDVLTSFSGEKARFISGTPPHKPGSSGRVYVEEIEMTGKGRREYFPTVYALEWVE